jgi:hypothetical protein
MVGQVIVDPSLGLLSLCEVVPLVLILITTMLAQNIWLQRRDSNGPVCDVLVMV